MPTLLLFISLWPAVFLSGIFKPTTMDALQRRVILEDMVQYKLFLIQPDGSNSKQTEERLTHLAEEILAKVAPLLIQYIWQHQSFNLKYHPEKGIMVSTPQWWIDLNLGTFGNFSCNPLLIGDVPAHIGGSTQFGDNVEDEWFIVYLLQQITAAFPELAARWDKMCFEFISVKLGGGDSWFDSHYRVIKHWFVSVVCFLLL